MKEEIKNILGEINNLAVYESFLVANSKLEQYKKIVASISGGSDSDIIVDLFTKLDDEKKVKYKFFDTGIEYEAQKKHLDYLEQKYGIEIERLKSLKPVPLGCKLYGVPFWSKHVSEMIERLQRHGFKWEDKPFEELLQEYPKCKVALKWWCNRQKEQTGKDGNIINSKFNISYIRGLKEFMIGNPPTFKISNKCCKGAKKDNAKVYLKNYDAALNVIGVRKAEGGIRADAYKNCFDNGKDGESWGNYRPIFWYSNADKKYYNDFFNVKNSDCYTVYGMYRTGCPACPFGKDFENELKTIEQYEPRLFKAVNNIFGASHEYTRKFLEFRKNL